MTCLVLSRVAIYQLFPVEKNGSLPFWKSSSTPPRNFLTSVTFFFISEREYKVWVVIDIDIEDLFNVECDKHQT